MLAYHPGDGRKAQGMKVRQSKEQLGGGVSWERSKAGGRFGAEGPEKKAREGEGWGVRSKDLECFLRGGEGKAGKGKNKSGKRWRGCRRPETT